MTPQELLTTVRRHWSIENNLHWQLDTLLCEDRLRGRKKNTAANHAILRRMTLNILRADPEYIRAGSGHLDTRDKWIFCLHSA